MNGKPFNAEQVFVAVDDNGSLLGGSLMFHGGHSIAYSGSTRIFETERQAMVAHKLFAHVIEWCKAHGITKLGHGAETEHCLEVSQRFGAVPTKRQVIMELTLNGHANG